jgi:hypothetical protein
MISQECSIGVVIGLPLTTSNTLISFGFDGSITAKTSELSERCR